MRRIRYPKSEVPQPANWSSIAEGCARQSKVEHFAQVAFASTDQPFQSAGEMPVPLWRGYGVHVKYEDLEHGLL